MLVPVVSSGGCLAGLPGPEVAVRVGDDGLAVIGCDRVGFHAFRQADRCGAGRVVGQVMDLPFCVQKEEPLVEGLGLENAHARVLPDAFGFDVAGVARIPGPGLPVRVQGEGPAAGGGREYCLSLTGQVDCGVFFGFHVRTVGLAGLVGVDLSLPVHRQQPAAVDADTGEPGVLAGIKNRG